MHPRSGFCSGGTSECTLVPVFVPREHPPKPPFGKTTLLSSPVLRGVLHPVGNEACRWKLLPEVSKGIISGKICLRYPFIADNPNILGNFLLFVGQDQLGENYQTYSHNWGLQNTLGKNYALDGLKHWMGLSIANSGASMAFTKSIYKAMYVVAVELLSGPSLGFSKVIIWAKFVFF